VGGGTSGLAAQARAAHADPVAGLRDDRVEGVEEALGAGHKTSVVRLVWLGRRVAAAEPEQAPAGEGARSVHLWD
jgi:hypothetical protein